MRVGDFGQPRLERLLDDMLARQRVAGSFLFDGPAGTGKEALAIELGRLVNCERDGRCPPQPVFARATASAAEGTICASCRKFHRLQHPDLALVFPVPSGIWEGDSESIQKILEQKARDPYHKPEFDRPVVIQAEVLRESVVAAVHRRPFEARIKVVIISDADQMAFGIGNLILKTLEEPPPDCLLVLTSSAPERLLPTIRSRCQQLRFAPLASEWLEPRLQSLYGATAAQAHLAASLSRGSMLAAARFVSGDFQEVRDRAFEVLSAAAQCDVLALLDLAETTAREATSKEEKRRHVPALVLQMMSVAARDALLVAEGAVAPEGSRPRGSATLVNADRLGDLQALARAWSPAALHGIVRSAEKAEVEIARHVHTELTYVSCYLELARGSDKARALAGRA
jgi:DNA polymerase-3 subunit delta'